MLAQALAIIDILAGIAILGQTYWAWDPVIWLGIIVLIKAIYSLATSMGSHFYFDFLGWIDLVVAVVILINFQIPWFFLVPIAKGAYSLVMIRM